MAEIKHTGITAALEERIRNRHYGDTLPPMRMLIKEFDSTMRTMTKALKPLAASGLIQPSKAGTKICLDDPKRKRVITVGIVYHQPIYHAPEKDVLLNELKRLAAANGCNAVLMQLPDDKTLADIGFWESMHVDGFIFVYSTFYKLMNRQLALSGIPFVVANWMPVNYGVHWVDFNIEQLLCSLVTQIIQHTGNHRIAFTDPNWSNTRHQWLAERWRGIADLYELPNYCGKDNLCFGNDLEATAKEWVHLPEPPEIVICHHRNAQLLTDIFHAGNLPVKTITPQHNQGRWYYKHLGYPALARETWKVFTNVLNGVAGTPRSHLIDLDAKINFKGD
jgi:DNA-binding transcriptional regulator YhcF (GntR family)